MATHYALDDPGIEIFQTGPEAHPASCTTGTGTSSEVKRPGRGADY
jgi:hypothetical protein